MMKAMRTLKPLFLAPLLLTTLLVPGADKPSVRVGSMDSVGPRAVEKQTQLSIVRDYLLAWQSLARALAQNRPASLDDSFTGIARDKLADTIREQSKLGFQTHYRDTTHNLQVIFYSPEGLSIQLLDDVEYDIELYEKGKLLGTQHVRSRYLSVLTPTESKWKVRIFEAQPLEQRLAKGDQRLHERKHQSYPWGFAA